MPVIWVRFVLREMDATGSTQPTTAIVEAFSEPSIRGETVCEENGSKGCPKWGDKQRLTLVVLESDECDFRHCLVEEV